MPKPSDLISVSALLCEKVLKDQDGLLSAIRIADTVSVPAPNPGAPFFVVVFVKTSATAPSQRRMTVHLREPDDASYDIGSDLVQFEQGDRNHPIAATMVLELWLTFKHTGLHWVDVRLEGENIATIPLMVYIKASAGA